MREEYTSPVGFASEPATEFRRWISRIILIGFVFFIGWLLLSRVINPPADNPVPTGVETVLPGPV